MSFLTPIEVGEDEVITEYTPYVPKPQIGPLRRYEKEMRCVHVWDGGRGRKNCGSATFFRLEGIPMCNTHCLARMNEMLIERDTVKAGTAVHYNDGTDDDILALVEKNKGNEVLDLITFNRFTGAAGNQPDVPKGDGSGHWKPIA